MRLCEGRIGNQEGASAVGLAAGMSVIFTLDSSRAYANGNATYITSPLAIIIAAGIFLLLCCAMNITDAKRLDELIAKTAGGVGRHLIGAITAAYLLFSAWSLTERFTTVMHSFVFTSSDYGSIVVWTMLSVGFMALMGFECIGRMAKIFGAALGVLVILGLVGASSGYEAYRLAPFPADDIGGIAANCAESVAAGFAPLLCILCTAPALQGAKSLRRAGLIGAGAAALAAGLTQLCLGLAYPYEKLRIIAMPLYRLNLILLQESYWFRLDELGIFIWFIGCTIASAYYIYCAASVITRLWTRLDVRPAAASAAASIAAVLLLCHIADTTAWEDTVAFIRSYAYFAVIPFALTGIAAILKSVLTKKDKRNEEA